MSLKEAIEAKEKFLAENPELKKYEARIQDLLDKAGPNRLQILEFLSDELKYKMISSLEELEDICNRASQSISKLLK